jgi:hypothetical protein
VNEAVTHSFLLPDELTQLTDELEEVGAQHVYLFKLTEEGHKLTAASMKKAFTPTAISADYYAEQPANAEVRWVERDGQVFLKQVHTAVYWEFDRKKSKWNDEIRRREWKKIHRRGVNLMLVDVKNGTAEICIDRLKGEDDKQLAEKELRGFLESLKAWLDPAKHLVPVRIAHAFTKIVTDTIDETFMNSDGAYDESIKHRISNRRRGTKGTDIRKNPDYNLDGEDYNRKGLTLYWFTEPSPESKASTESPDSQEAEEINEDSEQTEADDDRSAVYTIISAVIRETDDKKKKHEHCKIYISANISAKDREHVIGRIRRFAG